MTKARVIFESKAATPALTVVVEEGRKILAYVVSAPHAVPPIILTLEFLAPVHCSVRKKLDGQLALHTTWSPLDRHKRSRLSHK